ncbi:AAA family ATPase, partial [Gordonia sp. (in: high G+C Gram-positive bacteria)]|uniref:AAA family ATPase n=1 Tax=Gordonia sp. (in: high G+C Gram-positive bacteria) TaxID=84139 RepID=UPI0039E411B4
MRAEWPILERANEFDQIRQALEGGSDKCGVVLTGESGVGKTTLARLVTGRLGGARWIAGTESARSIPLGVFAHLVGPSATSDPVAYLAAARTSLLAEGKTIIGVDDAHLLDELSATLLHQLAIDRAVQIIATVRSGESVPDAVTSLWKDRHLLRMTLQPFTKSQSVDLVESVVGGRLEGLSADLMWDASGGNALFLRHLVDGAIEAGTLRESNGVWQLRGRTAITSELASLLEGRIDRLDDEVLTVLQYLSLCEPATLDVLSELAGDAAVERAEALDLIRIAQQGGRLRVQYTHPLFGEVIRSRMGSLTARRLRGRLVSVLQAQRSDVVSDRILIADLGLDSDVVISSDDLAAAANQALTVANIPMAQRFAKAAVDAGGGLEASEPLARALMWQGRADEAEAALAVFDPDRFNQTELIRWGLLRIGNLFWAVGDAPRAQQVLDLVAARVTQPALALIVKGVSSAIALFTNRLDEAITLADEVLADPLATPWAVEWAVFGGSLSRALTGRGDEVAALAEKAREAEKVTDGLLRFPAGFGEILALTLPGRLDEADQAARRYLDFSSAGHYLGWALSGIQVSEVAVMRGDLPAAVTRMEQTLAALGEEGSAASWAYPAFILQVMALSGLGQGAAAADTLARAQRAFHRHVAVFGPSLDLAVAWQAAGEGRYGRAAQLAVEAAENAAACGQIAIEAEAWQLAARFGDPSGAARLAELAARLDGPLIGVYARYAAAVSDGDGAALDEAASALGELGFKLAAADAAAQASVAHAAAGARTASVASSSAASRLAAE